MFPFDEVTAKYASNIWCTRCGLFHPFSVQDSKQCLEKELIGHSASSHNFDSNIHYSDAIMSTMTSEITVVSIVCSRFCSGADKPHQINKPHQSKLHVTGFLRVFHRWPVDSPHKGPITRKMFTFDDVIIVNDAADTPESIFNIMKKGKTDRHVICRRHFQTLFFINISVLFLTFRRQ